MSPSPTGEDRLTVKQENRTSLPQDYVYHADPYRWRSPQHVVVPRTLGCVFGITAQTLYRWCDATMDSSYRL